MTVRLPLCVFILLCLAGGHASSQPDTSISVSLHVQATIVSQMHPAFAAPYTGTRSLSPGIDSRTSLTSTVFLGWRPADGTEMYVNPELSGGSGLSGTTGIAGFPNGEIYRVDDPKPAVSIARLFLRQTFGFGDERQLVEDDENQIAGPAPARRLVVTSGKFSILDIFDGNTFSHDPRKDFLNWALMANGAWDYPADTRGYTVGVVLEYISPGWAARIAAVAVPHEANGMALDSDLKNAFGLAGEFELRQEVTGIPGTLRGVLYRNRARMASYRDALEKNPVDVGSAESPGGTKWGVGLNYEVEFRSGLGLFARGGWNDGAYETWAFTEIDLSASCGIVTCGALWGRDDDRAGIAAVINGLSGVHRDYLAAGGYGFIIGDGRLDYAPETIVEAMYAFSVVRELSVTGDYQFVLHPAYNLDRGPVHVFALRFHVGI